MSVSDHPGNELLDFLRSTLIGPRSGRSEVFVSDSPAYFYTLGVLFPIGTDTERTIEQGDPESAASGTTQPDDGEPEDPISLANQTLPSSAGISFFLEGEGNFICDVSAARYQSESEGRWSRIEIASSDSPESVPLLASSTKKQIMGGLADLHVISRSVEGGFLVTVAIVNSSIEESGVRRSIHHPERCLFQVGMRVRTGNQTTFGKYPQKFNSFIGEEEAEIELLYLGRSTYAIGHGCAATWDESAPTPTWIGVEFMPSVEVPPITRNEQSLSIQNLYVLAHGSPSELEIGFEEFLTGYKKWIDQIKNRMIDLPAGLSAASGRITERLETSLNRMQQGVELIKSDDEVRNAFSLANRAMIIQMFHGRDHLGGKSRPVDAQVHFPTDKDYDNSNATWYPFQLAFLLLIIPSLSDQNHEYRDIVDLIWFPTGGGKTEAYLAASAFEIIYRRIKNPDRGNGTAVISRYTLRLLTTQQFQRTAGLVCALEHLRSSGLSELAGEPITLGLWVGIGESPNSIQGAVEKDESTRADRRPYNSFGLDRCPWCGTQIVPDHRSESPSHYGFTVNDGTFHLNCPRKECVFTDRLPIQVVDEMLYREVPTILMGTVDKFAQLAWKSQPGVFFGSPETKPPGLIIQDELHLLSGPLGTTYGVYESGLDTLIKLRGGNPKFIASTATIRDAGSQTQGLFGRDVSVFPARGLDDSDSYFAVSDNQSPGRLYVGLMSSNHTAVTSLVRTVATVAQSPVELDFEDPVLDSYWTQVVYHNSLRELGNFLTQARDDVDAWIKVIANDEAKMRSIGYDDVLEVSSNLGSRSPEALSKMERSHDDDGSVSIIASSSMFSVGVDVQRLGLMIVNGQPRSTAEYIQATSRVGRGDVPGLVLTHFSPTKPRDRSHYESFTAYHRSLYRYVEASSVTPMSIPSRKRALHAALVIVIRHGVGFSSNSAAGIVDMDSKEVKHAIELLIERCVSSDTGSRESILENLSRLTDEWRDLIKRGEIDSHPLFYDAGKTVMTSLLRGFGSEGSGWETPYSMRNVDNKVWLEVSDR